MIRLIWHYLRTLRRDNAVNSIRRAWRYYRISAKDGLPRAKRLRIALCGAALVDASEAIVRYAVAARAAQAEQVKAPEVTWTAPGGQA
jgi:hypothetical protein